jgi:hypothetical protein
MGWQIGPLKAGASRGLGRPSDRADVTASFVSCAIPRTPNRRRARQATEALSARFQEAAPRREAPNPRDLRNPWRAEVAMAISGIPPRPELA